MQQNTDMQQNTERSKTGGMHLAKRAITKYTGFVTQNGVPYTRGVWKEVTTVVYCIYINH